MAEEARSKTFAGPSRLARSAESARPFRILRLEAHVKIALLAALALAVAPAAFAKGKKGMSHCMKADGTEDTTAKNKKDCAKAGGKWGKMKMDKGSAPSK